MSTAEEGAAIPVEAVPDWGDLERLQNSGSGARLFCCGCGCLLPIAILLVVTLWGYVAYDRGTDTERQWGELAEVAPLAGRPAGWALVMGFQGGWLDRFLSDEVYLFQDGVPEEPHRKVLLISTPDSVEAWFDQERAAVLPWTPDGEERALVALEVQGRDLRVAFLETAPGTGMFGKDLPAVAVDLTPPGAERHLVFVLHPRGLETTREDVLEFLAAFEIGPER